MGWLSNIVHTALDVAGMIPGVGAVADGLNVVIYAAEGDYANAAMSAIAMVPGIGDSIALASKGAKVMKGIKGLSTLEKGKFLLKGLKKQGAKVVNALKGVMKEGATFLKKLNPKNAFKNIKDKLKDVCLFGKCFTGETLVYTPSGYRAIREIELGDLVYSMNEKTGEVGIKKVEKISCTEVHTIYEIETEEKVVIKTTAYHPLYVAEKGWVNAINLAVGDLLISPDGAIEVKIIQKMRYEEPVKTYNFEVEDWVSYFVSELNVYVHNGGKHPKGNGKPKKEIGSDTGYQFNKDTDVDLRGEGDYKDALDIAFERTGESRDNFEVTQWGGNKNEYGKSVPVEYKSKSSHAEVSVDNAHTTEGAPDVPHVGYKTGEKKKKDGKKVGHIFVDEVPAGRSRE